MPQSSRATFLILAILLQVVVWLTPWGQEQRIADLANTVAHAQATAHHHHDDHSLHMDDHVTEAAQHQHASETFQLVGLVPLVNGFALDRARSTRFSNSAAPIAAVFLQGPLRPPQPTAV
ncbi:hypothetical protein [Limnohabitans sp. Hippo3]|uniref:hypothetical protein n=1 Tax=Limnohabitans sp. Hippo3 TaxID=1597956 RepID=UPI0011B22376|nr:hypothetical protein [Limnohabitans sp. Hippo3]